MSSDTTPSSASSAPAVTTGNGPYGAVASLGRRIARRLLRQQGQAEASAIATCARDAKQPCESKVWFKNACGALAMGRDGAYGTGWGQSPRQDCSYALQSCRDAGGAQCESEFFACSPRQWQGRCDGSLITR